MMISQEDINTVIENVKELYNYYSDVPSMDFVITKIMHEYEIIRTENIDSAKLKISLDEIIAFAIIGRAIINLEEKNLDQSKKNISDNENP